MRLLFAACLAVAALAPTSARAQFTSNAADQRALQLYEQGDQAYAEGRYEEAANSFVAAYRLSPRPLLLYNLANAYERLGRYQEAVQSLEQYLPDAPIDERAVIETRIRNLRTRLTGGEPAQTAETAGTQTAPAQTSSGGGGGGDGLLIAGIVLAATGGALVGGGAVFGVLALDAQSSLQGSDGACRETAGGRTLCTDGSDGAFSDAETYALLADIGLIGGGVIAAAGVVLILIGATSGSASGDAAWLPDVRVGPDGASAGVVGRF